MIENLLVCLRHCFDELFKAKGAEALSVVHLHVFQYHILAQALRYFQDDIQEGVRGGGSGRRSRTEYRRSYVPTLPSSAQPPGGCYINRIIWLSENCLIALPVLDCL